MGLHPSPPYLAMGFTNPLFSLAALDKTYFYEFNWQNGMFGHASKRNTNLALKYGILTGALRRGLFGSNIMTRFSTKRSGMNSKLRAEFGKIVFIYGKSHLEIDSRTH